MKARKTVKNNALIQEVISQISRRFAPKISEIKEVCDMHTICRDLILIGVTGHRYHAGEGVY